LIFGGDARTRKLNQRLFDDIQEKRGRAALVGEESSVICFRLGKSSSGIRQILEILPVQMITLALALQAGREPGRFAVATKVTTTE